MRKAIEKRDSGRNPSPEQAALLEPPRPARSIRNAFASMDLPLLALHVVIAVRREGNI